MTWSAEFEYRWQLFLTGLETSKRGLFMLEYDQPATRDIILERIRTDFTARGWPIPDQFFVSRSLMQSLRRAIEGKSVKAAVVHLDPDSLESTGLRMLNLERENLYNLSVNIIFLAPSAAYRRLLSEARDLATWLNLSYSFTTAQSDVTQVSSSPKSLSQSRSGLTGELLQTLSDTLLCCGPFYSARELNAVFADTRLYPWRYNVPEADSPKARVQALIAYLHNKANVDGDNALVLFLRVLQDQTDANDACYSELGQLAATLGSGAPSAVHSTVVFTDPYTPYEIAMHTLFSRLGKEHPRYNEALIYQQRLDENLEGTRLYGDTETRRAERAEILARLNALTMATLHAVFSELSGMATTINTGGGAYAGGNVTTSGDFVGRDKITIIGDGNVIGNHNQVAVNKPATTSQTPVTTPGLPDRVRLLSLLTRHFSLDELNTLCFAVGVNYDELPGAGLTGKARELIGYCERHTCMPTLIASGKTLRPELDWS
jgi:hypothetical protein